MSDEQDDVSLAWVYLKDIQTFKKQFMKTWLTLIERKDIKLSHASYFGMLIVSQIIKKAHFSRISKMMS